MAVMSHSYEVSADSPASVEQIHAAFGREDYWLARFAAYNPSATKDSLTVDAEDTVSVSATQYLGRQLLPEQVVKLLPGDLKLMTSKTWRPAGTGQVRGKLVNATGGFGSALADASLAPAGNGSTLHFAGKVEVKIPCWAGNSRNPMRRAWPRTSLSCSVSPPRGSPNMPRRVLFGRGGGWAISNPRTVGSCMTARRAH
jgi:hypothetical protein